jgi:molybdopterin-guanine dinucleotide biosynthesis protein MobB
LKTTVIAVVGGKKSGKTTTIEALTRELTRRGYGIAVVKHVPEPNFTIDTEGKDTWRFAQAGAKTIVAVSSDEIATIEKTDARDPSLKEALKKCGGSDIVFLEGFRKAVSKNRNICKIVVVRSGEEALEAANSFSPILAFTGPYSTIDLNLNAPYVGTLKNPGQIADIVEKVLKQNRA